MKVIVYLAALTGAVFLSGCGLLGKATPLGAATAVADAAAEQTESAIRENIAGAEVDIAESEVEAAKIVMDGFKDCWVEFLADRIGVDSHSACTACAERFGMSKAICLQVRQSDEEGGEVEGGPGGSGKR